MEIREEDFERPESVSSLGKVLERVKADTTPTAEKEIDFLNLPGLSLAASEGDSRPVTRQAAPPDKRPGLRGGADLSIKTDEHDLMTGHDRFYLDEDQYPAMQPTESPGPYFEPVSPIEDDGTGGLEMGLGIREGPGTPTQQTFST